MPEPLDLREFDDLIADLGKVGARAVPAIDAVVERGAVNIKKSWAEKWSGLRHAPAVGRAVTYDRSGGYGWVGAEIGPDKDRPQGALGNLLEFGSVKNAPIPGGQPALDEEAPRFEKAISDVAADAVVTRS